jgi:hypothetical protein
MLTDNIVFLKKNFPDLYEKVKKEEEKSPQTSITIENTKNNQKTLKMIKGDKNFYLHSKYNPTLEAETILKKLEEKENIDENSYVVFYGIGLGYHIELFTQRYPNTSFSLYEPSVAVFQCFLDNVNLKNYPLKNLINMQCEFESENAGVFITSLLKNTNKNLIVMDLPIYENIFNEQHNSFFSIFKQLVKNKRSGLHTNYSFQKRWIINSMKNLKYVLSTPNIIAEKYGEFKGKTAILVAAGPSLNEEIDNLRYIKDNGLAYIFTVGSAINTLVHNNIYPHAACTYDPTEKNQIVFQLVKEKEIKDIPMIFGSSVGYETIENYPGNQYHMITSQDTIAAYYLQDKKNRAISIMQDAPSIAVITLQLLYALGCKNVLLVGQNLGYRGKDRYSEGISYSSELTDKELESAIWVKDVYGNEILTNDTFNLMRLQIEYYIKLFLNMRVINTTKGGANIEGTEFIELRDIMETSLKERVVDESGLNVLEGEITSYDKDYIVSQSRNMDKSYDEVLKINKELLNIINKIEKAINNRSYAQAQNLYVKLDEVSSRLEKNDFYKTFIIPMNRVQHRILAETIESLNEGKSYSEKGKGIVKGFREFINICNNDIEMIQPIYDGMKEVIANYTESSLG